MRMIKSMWVRTAGVALFSATAAAAVEAQVCLGNPAKGGIAYVNGKSSDNSSNGAVATFTPGNFGLGLGFRAITAPSVRGNGSESGFEGAFRFSLVLGGKLQVCPTISLGFDRRNWNADANTTLTTNQLVGRGGLSVGYDVTVTDDFDIAPFVGAEYVDEARYFQTKGTNSTPSESAGNTGGAQATYGIMLHYMHIFGGFSASHGFKSGPASDRRLFVGFAF